MKRIALVCQLIAVFAIATAVRADPVGDFYQGKTIRLIVATGTGDGYTTIARIVARHLPKYLPGHPGIVIENMPGADGIVATNYLYRSAPADGTVLVSVNSAIASYQAIGQAGIQFKAEELSWIGAFPHDTSIIVVWHTAGVKTIADAMKKEVVIGATGPTGTMATYPALLNSLIGTKFRIVAGYAGGNAVNLAMERGEVEGRGTATWATFKVTKADWVRDGKIVPLVQIGSHKDAALPNVPMLTELAQNDEQRQIFQFVSGARAMGQPFVAPPAIPPERLDALRRAFLDMGKDEAFIADAAKAIGEQSDMELIAGTTIEKIVRDTVGIPPALAKKASEAMAMKAPRG